MFLVSLFTFTLLKVAFSFALRQLLVSINVLFVVKVALAMPSLSACHGRQFLFTGRSFTFPKQFVCVFQDRIVLAKL